MTIELTQVNALSTSLQQETHAPKTSDSNFEYILEEEKKRLGLLFSPMTSFNFNNLFAYPSMRETNNPGSKLALFSDILTTTPEQPKTNNNNSQNPAQNTNQPAPQSVTMQNMSTSLQSLLQKSGFLIPNIVAQPLFAQALAQGSLLSSYDLQGLIDQIVSQLKLVTDKGATQLQMTLTPENLGSILLTLVSKSGMISIQIQANEETKKLLDADLEKLISGLKKANINLSELKIVAAKEVGQNV